MTLTRGSGLGVRGQVEGKLLLAGQYCIMQLKLTSMLSGLADTARGAQEQGAASVMYLAYGRGAPLDRSARRFRFPSRKKHPKAVKALKAAGNQGASWPPVDGYLNGPSGSPPS